MHSARRCQLLYRCCSSPAIGTRPRRSNTQGIAPYFPNSRTLYVHRGTHGARADIERTRPDVMAPILEFLKTGNTSQLPTNVELPVPWNMELPPPKP